MLFTSPAFMFLFLPVCFGIYFIVGRKYRKYALLAFSAAFYILVNIRAHWNILFLALIVILTHFCSHELKRLISRGEKKIANILLVLFVCFDFVLFIAVRELYSMILVEKSIVHPIGASVFLLASISVYFDVYRGDAEPPANILDCAFFLTFFPVMLAGPVIKYKDFIRYTSNINFSTTNITLGAKLFMIGFIKRITVSAVLTASYADITTALGDNNMTLGAAVVLIILVIFITFFAFSGYSDMGCGICALFGIIIPTDFGNPLTASNPYEFSRRFFRSIKRWFRDYITDPLIHKCNGSKASYFFGGMIICVFMTLWYNTSIEVLLASLPLMIYISLDVVYGFSKKHIDTSRTLRIGGRIITIVVMALYWMIIKTGGISDILSKMALIPAASDEFYTYSVYLALFNPKYIIVGIIALLILIPAAHSEGYITDKIPQKLRSAYVHISYSVLIVVFLFSLIYFLPQFPSYAYRAYDFIII